MRRSIIFLSVFVLIGSTWAADPFVGTWKLNAAKSQFDPPESALKSDTVVIEAQDNGLKFTFDRVDATGKAIHAEQAPKFDSKDYAVKGDPSADTVTMERLGPISFGQVTKKSGKIVSKVTVLISRDGNTSTVTSKTKDAKKREATSILIYEKQ